MYTMNAIQFSNKENLLYISLLDGISYMLARVTPSTFFFLFIDFSLHNWEELNYRDQIYVNVSLTFRKNFNSNFLFKYLRFIFYKNLSFRKDPKQHKHWILIDL